MRTWISIFLLSLLGCATADLRTAEEMVRQQKFYNGIELYLTFVRENSQHRQAPAALFEVGNIQQLMLNDHAQALATYRKLVNNFPISHYTINAQQRIAEIFKTQLADYRQAIIEYEKLIQAAPRNPDAANYQFEIAQCYTLLHNHEQAAIEFQTLMDTYKDFERLDEVYFQAGNNFYISGLYDEAIKLYEQVLLEFPKSSFKAQARFGMGGAYEEMDNYAEARKNYEMVVKNYPSPKVVQIRLKGLAEREKKKTKLAKGARIRH